MKYLEAEHPGLYERLILNGTLDRHLADANERAVSMLERLIEQIAAQEGVTEILKEAQPLEWVGRMNSIRSRVIPQKIRTIVVFSGICQLNIIAKRIHDFDESLIDDPLPPLDDAVHIRDGHSQFIGNLGLGNAAFHAPRLYIEFNIVDEHSISPSVFNL